jgi:hypothetical protein
VFDKRVHGYEKWKLKTVENQSVAPKLTYAAMKVDS